MTQAALSPQPSADGGSPSAPSRRAGGSLRSIALQWGVPAGVVVAGVVAFLGLGAAGVYSVPFIVRNLPAGAGPAELSLLITVASFAIGFVLAMPIALLRSHPPRATVPGPEVRALRARLGQSRRAPGEGRGATYLFRAVAYEIASGYVAAIRGTPFFVQVYLTYYLVIFAYPRLSILGETAQFWAGLLALTINTTAYQSEALRGGFQSIASTQIEAARALGLTRAQTFFRITLPQGVRLVTLPLTNEWISNFKTSTIVGYLGVIEFFNWSQNEIAYGLARPIEAFAMLTIFYLSINVTLSRVVSYIEQRRRIPGLGAATPEAGWLMGPGRSDASSR